MTFESRADRLAMVAGWDVARFGTTDIPGVFNRDYAEALETAGTRPLFTCVGERVTEAQATLYAADNCTTKTVNVGDAVARMTRFDGELSGPYTVRVIQSDGAGMLELVLEEQ